MVERVSTLGSIRVISRHRAITFGSHHLGDSSLRDAVIASGGRTLRVRCPPTTRRTTASGEPTSRILSGNAKRATIAKWTLLANRVGYLFVALAMALFLMAFVLGFNSTMATLVIIFVHHRVRAPPPRRSSSATP